MRVIPDKKLNFGQRLARRVYPFTLAFMATMLSLPSSANIVLPNEPLATGARIPPNVLFVLDNSGSMGWDFMPDAVAPVAGVDIRFQTYARNVIYYNPDITYLPWLDHTGAVMAGGTTLNSVFSDMDRVPPFNGATLDLSAAVHTYYVPSTPAVPASFGDVANYWRYQILPTGVVQRSEYDFAAILENVPTGYPFAGQSGAPGSFNTTFATFTVPANVSRVRVTATGAGGANLYMHVNAAPTAGTWTGRNNTGAPTKTLDRANPGASEVIFVGLEGRPGGFAGLTLTMTFQVNGPGCTGWAWVNCTNVTPTGRSDAEEVQNFATWYSYHRTRMKVAKAGAGRAFAEIGANYRVGYRNIWNNMPVGGAIPGGGTWPVGGNWATHPITRARPIPVTRNRGLFDNPSGPAGANNNRTAWYQRLYAQQSADGTPLRAAMWNAGNYFATDTAAAGPWGPEAPVDQFACRQNFMILTTDGFRNDSAVPAFDYTGLGQQVGEQDSVASPAITSPSGATFTYTPGPPFASPHMNTMADIAMFYWKTDLRADMLNVVPPSAADPAFWQHMSTFAISIGVRGTLNPATDLPLMTAGAPWPFPANNNLTSIDDLWHSTINGRGSFTAATNPDQFSTALRAALSAITERTGSFSNVAANSTSLDAGTRIFQATYRNVRWTGELKAFPVVTSATLPPVRSISAVPAWEASSGIPLVGARKLFSSNGAAGTLFPAGATAAQLTALNRTLTFPVTGANNAAYIAGARNLEIANGGTLRNRPHLMGDIVGSSPVYSKETDTVFVGANDGMLRGINAATGAERFAFIPSIINWGNLGTLSSPDYLHQYFVDGPLVLSTLAQTPGKTLLVGALGKGGKGLFSLDVTSPATFGVANVKWQRGADDLPATIADNNIGLIQSKPIIAKLNNGVTAVIVSNGINSTNNRSVLLIYNLATGALIKEIDTGAGSAMDPNGLSAPAGWDRDGNGTLDHVYAGDMLGNVWKFNLRTAATGGWVVANAGSPMFVARDSASNPQPITSGIAVAMHPTTYRPWLFFGTGRLMTAGDLLDNSIQSYYAFVDDGSAIVRTGGGANLTQRKLTVAGFSSGKPVRGFEAEAPLPPTAKGWYLDLVPPPPPPGAVEGERVLTEGQVVGNVLVFASAIPTSEACDPNGRGYINAVNAFTGTSSNISFFDLNGDGNFGDAIGGVPVGSVNLGVGMPTLPALLRGLLVVSGSSGGTGSMQIPETRNVSRVSWREVVRD